MMCRHCGLHIVETYELAGSRWRHEATAWRACDFTGDTRAEPEEATA